ncbi:MAG: carboxylesterase family protein, partial [Proteobacteria bacterium]|nr:carboxylesterase family protein [Pseudomonadota bacterium]
MKKAIVAVVVIVVLALIAIRIFKSPDKPEPRVVTADSATERTTENGRVVGFLEDNGGHTWLGVPFAKPPVGDLRWKAPLPAE